MARFRDPGRADPDDGFANIPYGVIAPLLMGGHEQRLVPFLGAGASRPASAASEAIPAPVDSALLQDLTTRLHVQTEDARLFLEIALAILMRLNAVPAAAEGGNAYERVRQSTAAPSAAELAQALADISQYDYFGLAKRRVFDLTGRRNWDNERLTNLLASLARLTAIGSPGPPLLDASSYCADRTARPAFWSELHRLFENKAQWTETHDLVATAASTYLATNDDLTAQDFLVITTNYDCLLENAFDAKSVPYYVLTVPRAVPPRVTLRFSDQAQKYLGVNDAQFKRIEASATEGNPPIPRTTSQFSGLTNKPRPLVALYKIHGSLEAKATADKDSVVITNEDYIAFLSVAGSVPSYFTARLREMGLLLLGYSFSDWNIRSLYGSVTESRAARSDAAARDYAVLLNPSAYETGFFDRNHIDILDTPLDLFCKRMRE
jgi:hypothetical protein